MRLSTQFRAHATAAAFFLLAPAPASAALEEAPCDTVSVSAVLIKDNGWWGHLGGEAGCRRGALWGRIEYLDHEFRFQMGSTEITAYLQDPSAPDERHICGWGEIVGQPGRVRFRVRVQDKGRRGTEDSAGIVINPGPDGRPYIVTFRHPVSATHGGGNVQLHPAEGPRAGGFFRPQEEAACGGLPPP